MSNQQKNYDEIWQLYVEKRMSKLVELNGRKFDPETSALCPVCGKEMFKKKRVNTNTGRIDKKHSWDIYVIDQKLNENDAKNLQPMHPDCVLLAQQIPTITSMLNRLQGMANPWHSQSGTLPETKKTTTSKSPK